MSISIRYLARLGREREIPSLFERAWMETHGGGSNPVAKAMQIVENERKSKSRKVSLFVGVMLLVPLAFLVWSGLGGDMYSKGAGDIVAHLIQTTCLTLALIAIVLAHEDKGKEVGNTAESQIASFCECLDLMSRWTGNYRSFELEPYLGNDEAIKKIGTDILAEFAANVLRIQEGEKLAESPEAKGRLQESAGNARAEFTRCYNTLRQIGLASGGYDKYFEIAQLNIDAASKNLSKVVVV